MYRANPFQLISFEQEALALMEKTKVKAKEILQRTLEEAKKIRARAQQEGFQEGREKGTKQGTEQAAAAEKERIRQETAHLYSVLESIVQGIEEKRRGLEAAAEQDLVRLSVSIAERILKQKIDKDPHIILENLKHAVSLAARRESLEVRLHPEDFKVVEEYIPKLKQEIPDITEMHLMVDDALGRGGCIVLTPEGSVDAQIKTQLEEIERQLLS